MSAKLLAIYLNDHLAGATVGVELARRAAGANEGTPLGDTLEQLAAEIAEDRDALQRVMSQLGVGEDRVKVAAAWAAEKFGRLKLNGQLTGYSPLSRLVELEGLHVGISGKLELWRMLKTTSEARLRSFDLDELIKRAESQRRRLAPHRKAAAEEAISP
jgi:hypothetical protein